MVNALFPLLHKRFQSGSRRIPLRPHAVSALASRASAVGIEVQTLSQFAVGHTARPGLVLGYGGIPTGRIVEGLHRLVQCFPDRGSAARAISRRNRGDLIRG